MDCVNAMVIRTKVPTRNLKTSFIALFLMLLSVTSNANEYSLTAENQADGSVHITFDLLVDPGLTQVTKGTQVFSYFSNLTKFNRSTKKGYPEVLSKQATLSVAPGTEYSVSVVESEFETYNLGAPYLVGRGTITRSDDPATIPYVIDQKALTLSKFPESLVDGDGAFLLRNVSGYNFRFNITEFSPNTETAKVYTHLKFALTPKSPVSLLKSAPQALTPEVNNVLPTLFLNYQKSAAMKSFYSDSKAGDILVIYTNRDKQAIQPYIQHKQAMGFTVFTEEVAKGTNVKNLVKSVYNKHPSIFYVQLVGDWQDIKSDIGTDQQAPMDPMLGAVSGNDMYPDLAVGRFSASSASDVTTQVNKTIQYETNPGQQFWNNALGIASHEGPGDDGEIDSAHMQVIKTAKLLPNQYSKVTEVYDKAGNSAKDYQVAQAVNEGVHVINYVGHGNHNSWSSSGFNNSDINNLSNGNKLPIIFSVACLNGTFHETNTSFAETWLRKQNGGAVASLMATINQPWVPPMRGQDYMNDLLTGGYNYSSNPGSGTSTSSGKKTLGEIVVNSFALMLAESSGKGDKDTVQTWTTFGDASLKVVDDGQGGPDTGGQCYSGDVSLKLQIDNYGNETDWTLSEKGGPVLHSGGNYSANSNTTKNFSLNSGSYVFTINDDYGDGLSSGTGSYQLIDNLDSRTIGSGSDFGHSESTEFCVGSDTSEPTYHLSVENGSGDSEYKSGETTTISANKAPSGQVFDQWKVVSGSPSIADKFSATTTLTMGGSDATVTALYKNDSTGGECYSSNAKLTLQIDNYGNETDWSLATKSGSILYSGSNYAANSLNTKNFSLSSGDYVFTINDDYGDGLSAGDGHFELKDTSSNQVIVNGSSFGHSKSKEFCVGSGGSDNATYYLKVRNGSGDNDYQAGDKVTIKANSPSSGKVFDRWKVVAGDPLIDDKYSATTTLVMPNRDATVKALYKEASSNGECFTSDIKIEIQIDNYGNETDWNVYSSGGSILYSGQNYAAKSYNKKYISLNSGSYKFSIYDDYGDGLNAGENGYYRVTDSAGSQIAYGKAFGHAESTEFCVQ